MTDREKNKRNKYAEFFGRYALESKSLSFLVHLKTGKVLIQQSAVGDCLPIIDDWSGVEKPENQKLRRRMIKWLYKRGLLA